ncbi:probable disease resistance protein At5g63020 [Pistacia vera]|uniref:probable disease resistance protein At5g63020 n=1 Tax=Pistacia vera TaxID=55513 RepID=UPI0012631A78|nr:probable disease resistance protein At5g63020 [Pistacia vera]
MMRRVLIAEQQQMKRMDQVQGWLSRVQVVEIEVGELLQLKYQEVDKYSCIGGYCSKNCKSRYEYGEKVIKMLKVAATLKVEGDFNEVAERLPEDPVDERPIEQAIVGLESTFDKVWRCLGEESVGIIGLYGMGGVGKTTLLTQINNKFLNTENDFDVVIWVVASKDLRIERIQEKIGKRIGLSEDYLRSESFEEKASKIFKIMSKKKFVLLLDDIWERVDLNKVGVPTPNPKMASKIVFTTRIFDVCGFMDAHRNFKVTCLTYEDSWKLFQSKVGKETLDSHPDILELAETVVNECAGLPLALITIGRAMANKKTPEEWSYAIQVLRRSASEFARMGKEVYPLLKFSYDSLSNDTLRSCLLYCALFPEDYNIFKRDLIDYWIGEGFLDEYDNWAAQNKGYYIIGVLLDACLLEKKDDDYVKMHDVIRDMALWIACDIEKEKENFLVHAGEGLTEAKTIIEWEGIKRLSLMENKISHLSNAPRCPQLQTLFLNRNKLGSIRNDFFEFMPSLRVLNLSHNCYLWSLPTGISALVSLQCLDVSGTDIKLLPIELKALKNLKCLNLEYTLFLNRIPQNLISNFPRLHVLRMFSCGYLSQTAEFLVEELRYLENLNVLSITLKSFCALRRFLDSEKLQCCTQSLSLEDFDNSEALNVLSLAEMKHLGALNIYSCAHLEELAINNAEQAQVIRQNHGFHHLRMIHIESCFKFRDLTWLIFAPKLEIIHISSCQEVEETISVAKLSAVEGLVSRNLNPFAKLQYLTLEDLRNLRIICQKTLFFQDLKEARISNCPKLKKLAFISESMRDCKIFVNGERDRDGKLLQLEDKAIKNLNLSLLKQFFVSSSV